MKYKTRYWLLTLCFLTIASTALAQRRNILSVPDTKVSIGQALLPVTIENTDEIVGLQFDITLPTAVTAGNEAVTTNRCDGHTIIIRKMEATRYRVMLYSEGMKPLIAQQGTVFFIPITTPQSYSQGGEHPMSIGNATMTIASGENVLTDAKAGKLIVSDLPDLTVKNAGGFLIQVLPFASDEIITQIEQNITKMQSVTKLMEDGRTTDEIALMALDGLEPNVLDDFKVDYRCDCSRERTERVLISLGEQELNDIIKDGDVDIKCHFCGKHYSFTPDEVRKLLEESKK